MPEADYRDMEHGRLVDGDGWFVLNLAEAGAQRFPGLGWFVPFESREHRYPQFGINVHFLAPGEPNAMYHRETAHGASTPAETDSSAEAYAHLEGDFEPSRSGWPFDDATG